MMLRRIVDRVLGLNPFRRRVRREVAEEIQLHVELRTNELVRGGMSAEKARAEAAARFGDMARARRRIYDATLRSERRLRFADWLDTLRLDATSAARRIRANPAFSSLSVATFALGIGLTTTMFAIVDATVLRPLPFPDSEHLVSLLSVREDRAEFPWVSSTNWLDWRDRNESLESSGLYRSELVNLAAGTEVARVMSTQVGGHFFQALAHPMLRGRPLLPEETGPRYPNEPGAEIVVSEAFWQRFMNADPDLGEVVIGGISRQVVGVIAAPYVFPEGTDVWLPATYRRLAGGARNNINWFAVARLAPGHDEASARADLDRVATWIRETEPEGFYSWGVGVVPLKETVLGDADRTLALLLGAVLAVLLIACANLAGQAYARSLGNLESGAVRRALGASRWRVVQHGLIEHFALALLGGGAGLMLMWAAMTWIRSRQLPLPRVEAIGADLRVVAVALLLSLLAGLAAGILPAVRTARTAPREAMGTVRGAGGNRAATAGALVAAEIALSVVLLVGSGVLVRGFVDFVNRDMGFEPDNLLVTEIELAGPDYEDSETRGAFWQEVLAQTASLPQITGRALANEVPGTDRAGNGLIRLADQPDLRAAATYRVISDEYFQTLGIPLLTGRDFDATDRSDSARVAIVSRAFVDYYWPDGKALGRSFQATSMEAVHGSPDLTIIGVVENIDGGYGTELQPVMYTLYRQVPYWTDRLILVTRTAGTEIAAAMSPLHDRLREVDPGLASETAPMVSHLAGLVARDRLVMSVLNVFALLAAALAALGVHGLMSFVVARGAREISIRSALGASRRAVLGLVLGRALRLTLVGTVAGLLGAWWLTGLLRSQLTELDPTDPVAYTGVALSLGLIAIGAAALPAWRAARLDPASTLRGE